MRSIRRLGLLTGLMILAMLPAVAAMADVTGQVALATSTSVVAAPAATSSTSNALAESGVLVLVGTALMGLASVVRRATRN